MKEKIYDTGEIPFTDGLKWDRNKMIHVVYLAIYDYYEKNGKLPIEDKDVKSVVENTKNILKKLPEDFCELNEEYITKIIKYCSFNIQPIAASFGGIIAQEIVKYTGKYTPISQFLYIDWVEILPTNIPKDNKMEGKYYYLYIYSRYDDLIGIYGKEFHNKITNIKVLFI